ncbi:hypothetical protein Tco_1103528 [Tanacetum coccineum]
MKRVSRDYSEKDFALFPTMISAPETSPSRITSSPSLSPQHTPVPPSTSQPPNTQPTPDVEEVVPIPYESLIRTDIAKIIRKRSKLDKHRHGDKMPKATTTDISLTKSYIPKVSKIPGISPTIAQFYKPIENRNIHEGRVVDQAYYKSNNIKRLFTNIRFNCPFQINEKIVPRFILDFYSQVTVQTNEYGYLVISFMIQHEFITLTLAQFDQILKIPYNGQAVFTNEWDLVSLEYSREIEGPYRTDLSTPDDIRQLLELECAMTRHSVSSLSSHHQGTSSHQHDDDDNENVKTSRASTPSPTTYLNSLDHLNYQNY